MKKLLSVLLVVLMLVGMLPMNAIHTHAAETTETLNIYGSTGTKTSDSLSISWTSNDVTFTNAKASSSTAIRTSDSDHYRLYAGSSVTVSAPGNITKIVVTCTSSSYATALKNSAGSEATASSSTVTIVPTASASSYTIGSMTAQARIKTVAVTYAAAAAACEHTNTTETTENATCTAAGSTKVVCDDCGETVSETVIPALGHNYVDGTCSACGAQKAVVEITFSGATVQNIQGYAGDSVTLPSVTDPDGYAFVGWVTERMTEETTDKPTTILSGEYVLTENTTLYALYSRTEAGTGTGEFTLVTDVSKLSAGAELVIAANTKGYVAGDISSSVMSNKTAEFSDDYTTISSLPDDAVILTLGGNEGAWTLKNANGKLLGATAAKKLAWGSGTTTWIISISNGQATISNGTNSYGRFLYNVSAPRFTTYATSTSTSSSMLLPQLYMKSGSSSTIYYLTNLPDQACTHENTTTTTVEATCTVAGSTTVVCNDCDATVSTTEIPALGHSYGTGVVTAPTCIAEGYTTYTCSACGHSYTDNKTEPTGEHNYVDGSCSVCGAEKPSSGSVAYQLVTDSEEITAGGQFVIVATDSNGNHFALPTTIATKMNGVAVTITDNKVVFVEGTTPVWTVESYDNGIALYNGSSYLKYSSSTNLGTSTTEYEWTLTAFGDAFKVESETSGRGLVFRAGTNYNLFGGYAISNVSDSSTEYYGVKFYKMVTLCEHENTEDHDAVAATCTAVGYTAGVYCTDCKTYIEGHEEIPMLDHSYNDGVVTSDPTCTATGVKTYTCSACGGTKTESIPATGHTMGEGIVVDPTCETAGSKTYTCTVCGESQVETIPAINHNWVESERTDATCDTDGKISYICSNDSSHTKTEAIPATGHSYVNGVCSVCKKEVSRFQLVTDYTQILAGGEYIVAAKVGNSFYAINSASGTDWLKAKSVDVTIPEGGTGADMMIIYEDGLPIWKVDYYNNRINCFSLYSVAAGKYLAGTSGTGLTSSDDAWAWQFRDAYNGVTGGSGVQEDGEFAVTQSDGSVAFVAASADYRDRTITLNNSAYTHYSVRTGGYNRELYFFKLVEANETEYTVKFVENGITTITQSIPVDDNVLKMPEPTGAAMPEGYTKFVGWVTLPHMESLVAPATIYSAEQTDGSNNTAVITEDTTFYALYSREDPDAEGQSMSYHRVTDTNQLVVGEKYIIVGLATDGGYWAMSKDQLSDDRGASLVVPDANGVITFLPEDNVAVFELAQGHEIGSFAFLDLAMNMFLYCSSSDSNASLKSQATLNSAASFAIDILKDANTGYYSTINANVSVNRSYLMFNTIRTEDRLFSSYALYADSDTEGNLEQNTFLYVGVPNSVYATYYTTGLCNHTWNLTNHVEATCENAGYSLYTCSLCGEIKMEDVQAHGHTIGSSVTTLKPTCTTTGTATATCTNCGAEFTDVIPALGHTEVVDAAVAATCTETGWTEGSHCSVCSQIIAAQQVAPALGHDYDAEQGKVVTSSNGYYVVVYPCVRNCGAEHEAAQLKFTNASLTLQNNIVVNFKTPANVMGEGEYAGFSDLRAEFTYGNRVGENMIKATSAEIVQQADGKYSVPCRRVTPSQIGDEITATLYGTYDGVEYSFKMKYSAAKYCYDTLKDTNDAKLKSLLVDLLYYCDAARAYTTYQGVSGYTGSVTEELTEELKAYRTVSDEFTSVKELSGEGEFAATWKSASLILGEATSIRFRVDLGGYDIDAVTVKATVGGKDYTDISVKQDGETYLIQIDGISAHRMRETVEVTLSSGGTVISKTVSYSIESYVAEMTGTNEKLKNMLIAMMSYGDAAAAYNA